MYFSGKSNLEDNQNSKSASNNEKPKKEKKSLITYAVNKTEFQNLIESLLVCKKEVRTYNTI